ncbi:hypothetical protein QR680_017631 [Steinernema hermaphroditum]|uniref:Uncharacterized protein n=1 Tax=Steinernema hermaphroditum TaxID=289476 RepID=A0AA39LPQ9_9BILA|nr:hypothetical protein QR680_017631 [Steinernema hermaphroditum]
MTRRLWVSLLLVGSLVAADIQLCSQESDCAPSETCRRLCNFEGHCQHVCVTSSVKARILRRSTSPSAPLKTTTAPFTVMTNPFKDEFVKADAQEITPQTFSEDDFERELRESSPDVLPSAPAAPPSPPLSISTEAMPPSLAPEAPGFEEFKTGYTNAPPTTSKRRYPEDKPEALTSPEEVAATEAASTPPTTSTSRPWFITSTFAPALGVEKNELVKESGYSTEDADVSNANETLEATPTIHLPVAKAAYFGGVTMGSMTEGVPTTSSATYSSDEGVEESKSDPSEQPSTSTTELLHLSSSPNPQKYDTKEAEVQQDDSRSECPTPVPCGKNCGIFIDENGCQGCQCLWQSLSCANDTDCLGEGLYCYDGRCECRPGYVQNMQQSGVCRLDPTFGDLGGNRIDQAVQQATTSQSGVYLRRTRRASLKPRRMERLQWPGPCDNDDHCPPNLYCLQGDCWHLPDKPIRAIQHDPPPKSFPIEGDGGDDDAGEGGSASSVQVPPADEFDFKLFPSPPPSGKRGRSRFVTTTEAAGGDYSETAETFEETTTTSTTIPATTTLPSTTLNPEAFTKMIEVPDFSQIVRRRTNRQKTRASTPSPNEEEPSLDPVEFPISSKLQKERLAKRKKAPTPKPASISPAPLARTSFSGPTGVWHSMEGPDKYIPKPAPQIPEDAKVFLEYTAENRRRKPIRVELFQAKKMIHDECRQDSDCGKTFVCCEKKWCDLTPDCGSARFCLPHCDMTKMTYLSSMGVGGVPLIDIIYD